jgi:hypothetical protein
VGSSFIYDNAPGMANKSPGRRQRDSDPSDDRKSTRI